MDPRDPHNPLNSYTTDQLLSVISARFDCFVFVGAQTKSRAAQDLTYSTYGAFHSCLGLIETAKMLITAGGPEED
jgi:hypothetical protein